jgi:DNA-binding transcriptional regulator GbsR (MarR family)
VATADDDPAAALAQGGDGMAADETGAAQDQHLRLGVQWGQSEHAAPPVISVLTEIYDESTMPASTFSDHAMSEEPATYDTGDPLTPVARRFVMHWGEMGSRWGVNRTVAQIHALLFLSDEPLSAERIADVLVVARSNVSNSLRELQNLHLVRVVHKVGDRRDLFEGSRDVWELFRTIVRERKTREFDPTVGMLRECVADPAFAAESSEARRRIRDTLTLMDALGTWGDEMLRLEPSVLMKIMKLGAKIQKLLRAEAK